MFGETDYFSRIESALRNLIDKDRSRASFLEPEVKELLRELGFHVPRGRYFHVGEGILPADLKYPLVAKVSSQKVVSKSDVHGVKIGIENKDELADAVQELSRIEHAEGILVEEMAPKGLEVVVGGVMDEQFGPVVMFGLGGVFVELFKDVSFGLAPLDSDGASWLIEQIKGYALLKGYRGEPPVDIDSLKKIIVGVSKIMATGLVKEIDLNPVALYPEGYMTLDAKMLLTDSGQE